MAVSRRGRAFFEKGVKPLVSLLSAVGITPNMLTVMGLVLTALSLVFYSWSRVDRLNLVYAALLIALGGLLDGLDGPLARLTGRQSNVGAFLDSFTDRVSDILLTVGFLLTGLVDVYLAVAMLSTSMLVSYARARGEALNVSLKEVGLGERAVRILAAIVGTLAASLLDVGLTAAAMFIVVVASITVVQRVWTTLTVLHGRERG
jgi:archaetidylinositol phosphate synthase